MPSWPSRLFSVSRRRRTSWWKRQLSCLSSVSSSSPVDIPVGAGGGSGHGRLPGFLPAQSSSPSAEVYTQDRVQQHRTPCRTLTFQFLGVVFKVSLQIRVPQRCLQFLLETHFSPREKSVEVTRQVRSVPELPWTPAPPGWALMRSW